MTRVAGRWASGVVVMLAAVGIGLAGVGGCSKPESQAVFEPDGGLLDLKSFLVAAKASGQSTTQEAAAPVIAAVHLGADYYLRSGQIEYIWGTTLTDGPEAAGRIVAYQKTAAADGGWALFQDGSLKHLTPAEFAATPRAEP